MSIRLRRAEAADIPFIMACERRPGYERFVGCWPQDKHRAHTEDPEFRYLVAAGESGDIGFAILHETWMRPENLYLKRIAVHDAEKGHGKRVLAALTDWVFVNTGAHRFWLEVVETNPRARHVYGSCGWTEEGMVREGYFDDLTGKRGSFVQMSILKSEWPEKRLATMKLNQVTVPATDLERSVAFYKTLGFKLIVKNDHYARFEIGDGASTFSLHLGEAAGNGPSLYFECDDLDARVAELKARGIGFDSDPVDQSWLWREAWFSDPAGNRLCLYFAGENRRFPPWRLKEG